jgi:hypothetical protein
VPVVCRADGRGVRSAEPQPKIVGAITNTTANAAVDTRVVSIRPLEQGFQLLTWTVPVIAVAVLIADR